jgi:hypothetical protein
MKTEVKPNLVASFSITVHAENYHTVTIDLAPDGARTHVTLSQDNNPTEDARQHSEKNWDLER